MKNKISNSLSILATAVVLAVIALAAPSPSQAQSNMGTTASAVKVTPAQVLDQLLSKVEREMVPLAEAMPADKYNFAPTNGNFKGVRTFAEQIKHVASTNYYLFGKAASLEPANMPNMKALKSKEQIVQALKDSFAFGHRAIATLTPQNALETIKPVEGINTRAGVMAFAIIHMNDHFGQMVEYLRMNGMVPPSSRPRTKVPPPVK